MSEASLTYIASFGLARSTCGFVSKTNKTKRNKILIYATTRRDLESTPDEGSLPQCATECLTLKYDGPP